jgi:hypothetical protein
MTKQKAVSVVTLSLMREMTESGSFVGQVFYLFIEEAAIGGGLLGHKSDRAHRFGLDPGIDRRI